MNVQPIRLGWPKVAGLGQEAPGTGQIRPSVLTLLDLARHRPHM